MQSNECSQLTKNHWFGKYGFNSPVKAGSDGDIFCGDDPVPGIIYILSIFRVTVSWKVGGWWDAGQIEETCSVTQGRMEKRPSVCFTVPSPEMSPQCLDPSIVQWILRAEGYFNSRHTNVDWLQWDSCLPYSSVCEKSLFSHHGWGTCHLTRWLSFHPCKPFVVTQPDSAKMYFQTSSLFGDRDRRA